MHALAFSCLQKVTTAPGEQEAVAAGVGFSLTGISWLDQLPVWSVRVKVFVVSPVVL